MCDISIDKLQKPQNSKCVTSDEEETVQTYNANVVPFHHQLEEPSSRILKKRILESEGPSKEVAGETSQVNTLYHYEDEQPSSSRAAHQRKISESPEEEAAKRTCHASVVANHYNQLKETGIVERLKSKILHLRNFNNWIKSQFIAEYLSKIRSKQQIGSPLKVLDMCCGKGGDLFKWEKGRITHLICTDIAEVSVEQCKQRYQDLIERAGRSRYGHRFTAEFFACDATMFRLRERYKDPSIKLNLVSCQFAFHYCFESLTQAKCMVRNAAECLAPGGFFIATIPNADEIMKRLRNSSDEKKFGNAIYNIEFQCDTNPPPLFGAKYLFHLDDVVDCPEFLVHFDTLVKLCRKYGLKLERKVPFEDFYRENYESGKGLLQKMNGLETVSLRRVNPNDEEYKHFTQNVKGNPNRNYATLSKSEWEAATLYLVCSFVKCKNTWDAQGQPVFEFDD